MTVTRNGLERDSSARVGIGGFNYVVQAPADLGAYCADAVVGDDFFAQSVAVEVPMVVAGQTVMVKRPVTWAEMARQAALDSCRGAVDAEKYPELSAKMAQRPDHCLPDEVVEEYRYGLKVTISAGAGFTTTDGPQTRTETESSLSNSTTSGQFLNGAQQATGSVESASQQAAQNAFNQNSSSFSDSETSSGAAAGAQSSALASAAADIKTQTGVHLTQAFTLQAEGAQDQSFNACRQRLETACGDILVNMQQNCQERRKTYNYSTVNSAKQFCAAQGIQLPNGYCREMCSWLREEGLRQNQYENFELQTSLEQTVGAWNSARAKIKADAAAQGSAGSDAASNGFSTSGSENAQSGDNSANGSSSSSAQTGSSNNGEMGQVNGQSNASSTRTVTETNYDSTSLSVDVGLNVQLPSRDVVTRTSTVPFYNTKFYDDLRDDFRTIWKAQLKGIFCGQYRATSGR